jgi:hypothetical protein
MSYVSVKIFQWEFCKCVLGGSFYLQQELLEQIPTSTVCVWGGGGVEV